MTKFNLEFTFGANIGKKEVQEWLDVLLATLPEGAEGTLHEESMVLSLEDLTTAHEGRKIRFNSPEHGTVEGILEGVYPSGEWAETLIVDGSAYRLTFAAIEVLN